MSEGIPCQLVTTFTKWPEDLLFCLQTRIRYGIQVFIINSFDGYWKPSRLSHRQT